MPLDVDAPPTDAQEWEEHASRSRARRARPRRLIRTRAGALLVGLVAVLAVATLIGVLALWPHGRLHVRGGGAFGGKSLGATVVAASNRQCAGPVTQSCRVVDVRLTSGSERGKRTLIAAGPGSFTPAYQVGAKVRVVKNFDLPVNAPLVTSGPGAAQANRYTLVDYDRRSPMLWLALAMGVLVVIVGRLRGALSLVGLGASLVIVTQFVVPAIIAGRSPFLVALFGSLAVMLITVTLSSGLGAQSLAAALGIAASLLLAAGLGLLVVKLAHLNGATSDLAISLRESGSRVSLEGLVIAGMVIGVLGVLADMAVSQASAVMALRRANPAQRFRELYRGAFVVGRDHFAATINTLVFAYVGASLPLLILFKTAGVTFTDAINAQDVASPVVAGLVGAIALIVSVPATTALAALLAANVPARALPADAHAH
ncbi:MAG: hypothetical protein QOD76_985 [Solirubrobacteraceae bacterium]|nr:hypothetical protein [Solirubrobacteraceae bacterium]